MRKQRKGRRSAVRALLFVLLACTLGGAVYLGVMGFGELAEQDAGVSFYDRLAVSGSTRPIPPPPQQTEGERSGEASPPAQPVSALDFDLLRESCPDIVGWLRLEGTVIDYPIVQGRDNDFYLHHLADGTPNRAGSVMMDCGNAPTFRDDITILHGHHMGNGSMFSDLERFTSEDYFREHPILRLYTPEGDYDVAILGAYTVNGYAFDYGVSFSDEAAFRSFVENAAVSTGYETGVEVSFGDRLLMLSTCNYSFEGARFLVIGKLCG